MTIIYRNNGAWGNGKGANLTPDEVDGNFWDLAFRLLALETNPPSPNEIVSVTQAGDTITFVMADATTFGPITLPRPVLRPSITLNVGGATLTPASTQTGYYFRCLSASGCLVTIEKNSVQSFLVDAEYTVRQAAAGPITFQAAAGVKINGVEGFMLQTDRMGAVVTAKQVAIDEWDLIGLLAEDTTTGTGTA